MWLRCLAAVLALWMGAASAQDIGAVQSTVLTIDLDDLFNRSAFGQRLGQEFDARSSALAAENRRIEADLRAEEKRLTEERAATEPAAFRVLADAFDEKVRTIRREQDVKARALSRSQDNGREAFLRAAAPVLEQMMAERGASVVLDKRGVFISLRAVDITQEAITQIDTAIGDGTSSEE